MTLKDRALAPTAQSPSNLPFEALSESQLLEIRAKVDGLLGSMNLDDIDMARELMTQHRTVSLLQHQTLNDEDVPPNQKAQTANTFQALLQQLIKMRTELYTAERSRAIESMVIRAFTKCSSADFDASPEAKKALQEAKDLFFTEYEALLKAAEENQ
jgi:hypothetical protein